MFGGVFQNIADLVRMGRITLPHPVQSEPKPAKEDALSSHDPSDPVQRSTMKSKLDAINSHINALVEMRDSAAKLGDRAAIHSAEYELNRLLSERGMILGGAQAQTSALGPVASKQEIWNTRMEDKQIGLPLRDVYTHQEAMNAGIIQAVIKNRPMVIDNPSHPNRERLEKSDNLIDSLTVEVRRLNDILRAPDKLALVANLRLEGQAPSFIFDPEQEATRQLREIATGMAIDITVGHIASLTQQIEEIGMFKVSDVIQTIISRHADGDLNATVLPPPGRTVSLVHSI